MEYDKTKVCKKLKKLEELLEADFSLLTATLKKLAATAPANPLQHTLVGQLQCHDIIRQKIQHVGQFQDLLEGEISQLERGQGKSEEVVSGILELSMAMLQYACMEYEDVREEISASLLKLEKESFMKADYFEEYQQKSNELVRDFKLLYLETNAAEHELSEEEKKQKLSLLYQSFSMQSERAVFQSLFDGDLFSEKDADDKQGQVELF